MTDDAAADRHQRHENIFEQHGERIDALEKQMTLSLVWRTGNGTPHRGAEARITRLEEESVTKGDLKKIAEEGVAAYQRTIQAKVRGWSPVIVFLAMVVYSLLTGKVLEIKP